MEELLLAQLQQVADRACLGMTQRQPSKLEIGWVILDGVKLPTLKMEF